MKRILFKTYLLIFCHLISTNLKSAAIIETWPIPVEIIQADDVVAAQKAIEQGYKIEEKYRICGYFGLTPLELAVFERSLNLVKFLISKGADINVVDYSDATLLMRAARWGMPEVVELLIRKHAKINLQDTFGNNELLNSLMLMLEFNQIESIKFLLNAGADYNQINQNGVSFKSRIYQPFEGNSQFKEPKRIEVVKLFEEFLDAKKKIISLAEEGRTEEILELLKINPGLVNLSNEMGETVLSQAILFGHLGLIKKLFEDDSIIQKPDLLIDKEEDGSFGPSNPIEYSRSLAKKVYSTANGKFVEIIIYLTHQRVNQIIRAKLDQCINLPSTSINLITSYLKS